MKKECCPVCGADKTHWIRIAERKQVSPCQNSVFDTQYEAENINKVNIEMIMCKQCTFLFNTLWSPEIDLYSEHYNNKQVTTGYYQNYVNQTIEKLEKKFGLTNKTVFEVGCGCDAAFLKDILRENDSCKGIGYDPSYRENPEERTNPRLIVKPEYLAFDTKIEELCHLILSRHVIEHVENPAAMLEVTDYLAEHEEFEGGYIETPDVSWTLKNMFWYEFSWEHCSLFTPYSMKKLFQKTKNLEITNIDITYGNQYMQTFFKKGKMAAMTEEDEFYKDTLIKVAEKYSLKEQSIFEKLNTYMDEIKAKGNIALWGAAGKGNVFLNVFDAKREKITCVFDNNEMKHNKYISGTGHIILNPRAVKEQGIKTIILLTKLYYEEIKEQLHSYGADDVEIILLEDFCGNQTI